jgi:hypothetical protein
MSQPPQPSQPVASRSDSAIRRALRRGRCAGSGQVHLTLRDNAIGSTGEVNQRRWGLGGPSLPGLSPTREVPDDHHDIDSVYRGRRRRVGIHPPRTARADRVPGRIRRVSRCGTCRMPPRMPIRARRYAMTAPAGVSTGMPPTSSPPMSLAPLGEQLPEPRPRQQALRRVIGPKRRFCIWVWCGVLVVLVVVVVAAVERAIQRSDIGQPGPVPDLLLPEEPVAG